jgi:hypothetical protein
LLRICCATWITGRYFGLGEFHRLRRPPGRWSRRCHRSGQRHCHECRRQGFVRRRSWLMINPLSAVSWNRCPMLLDETRYGPCSSRSGRTTHHPNDGMGMHQASKPRSLRTGSRLRTISERQPSDVARTRTRRRVPSRQVPGIALTPPRSPQAPLPGVPRHGVDKRGCLGT